jgi:hypothetical protein
MALNLVPFAGIAFLWFIGVLRATWGRLTKGEIKYGKLELQIFDPPAFALLERLRDRKRHTTVLEETFKI